MSQRLGAYRVFLLIEAVTSLFFAMIFTISAIYRVQNAGLNPLQLVLVGTVLEGTTMIFQVPTGLIADIYSRRFSVIVGMVIMGIAFIVEGSFPIFVVILLAQVLRAIGFSFASGAEEAWVADEMEEDNITRVYLRGSQAGLVGTIFGTLLCIPLANISLSLPFIVGGILFCIFGVFLIFIMPETRFSHTSSEKDLTERINPWKAASSTLKTTYNLLQLRPILITILCIAAFYGIASEGFDRLWQDHFLKNFAFPTWGHFTPVVWFSLISLAVTLLSIVSSEIIRKRINMKNNMLVVRTLFVITLSLMISVIVFGLAGNFYVAVIAYLCASSVRQLQSPIYTAWVTQNSDSGVRATLLSASSQFDSAGQMVGGPVVGIVATVTSLRIAMITIGSVLLPVLALLIRTFYRSKNAESQ
jgi:MFS transporter, DHA3 family, tetracycline resistance protein